MAGDAKIDSAESGLALLGDENRLSAILARTITLHRPIGPDAYDCVKVIVVRDGSAILFSEFGQQPVKVGDAILLGANTLCGAEPEDHITVTTVYLDTDYLIDQVFWQYASLLADRLDAQGFAEAMYTEPAQILRLGERRAGMLMPWLDELVALSLDGGFIRHCYRMQALWFSIAHVISPYIKTSPIRTTPSQRATTCPTQPRHRQFAPLRREARRGAELLRSDPVRHWSVNDLADLLSLSKSQVGRIFVDAFGKTPARVRTVTVPACCGSRPASALNLLETGLWSPFGPLIHKSASARGSSPRSRPSCLGSGTRGGPPLRTTKPW